MTARERLDQLLESYTGIEVKRGGIDATIDTFLATRLRELASPSLDEYLARLAPKSPELELLLNAITVTHTWFLRDPGQLSIVERLFADRPLTSAPLSIWVPGCASGEDVYSLSILAEQAGKSAQVLGTDINSAALAKAERGVYGAWSVRDVPELNRYFTRTERGGFVIAERLKQGTRFERHNLLEPPSQSGFDVILCRNVLIYLSRERARTVIERLADALAPGGHLLLGASEVVFDVPPQLDATYIADRLAFRRATPTARRRPSEPTPRPTLIPHAPRDKWHAPLLALPASAASITDRPPPPVEENAQTDELLARGHAQLDASAVEAAIADYQLAVDIDPTRADSHMYLGIALYLEGQIERALHELRAAAFLDSKLWPASFYLAVCHEALGQLEEATREYRHVVRVASRPNAATLSPRHTAWHAELVELARRRAASHAVA